MFGVLCETSRPKPVQTEQTCFSVSSIFMFRSSCFWRELQHLDFYGFLLFDLFGFVNVASFLNETQKLKSWNTLELSYVVHFGSSVLGASCAAMRRRATATEKGHTAFCTAISLAAGIDLISHYRCPTTSICCLIVGFLSGFSFAIWLFCL